VHSRVGVAAVAEAGDGAMNWSTLLVSLAALAAAATPATEAFCWAAGRNPGFSGPPVVTQLAVDKVRVSWKGLVKKRECADNFVVK